jgi:hypothetical protein
MTVPSSSFSFYLFFTHTHNTQHTHAHAHNTRTHTIHNHRSLCLSRLFLWTNTTCWMRPQRKRVALLPGLHFSLFFLFFVLFCFFGFCGSFLVALFVCLFVEIAFVSLTSCHSCLCAHNTHTHTPHKHTHARTRFFACQAARRVERRQRCVLFAGERSMSKVTQTMYVSACVAVCAPSTHTHTHTHTHTPPPPDCSFVCSFVLHSRAFGFGVRSLSLASPSF